MRQSLLSKRSNTILGPIASNPHGSINGTTTCVSPSPDQQENLVIGPDVFKIRHTSSKVWSDIRGVFKGIARASQNGSEDSITAEKFIDEESSLASKVPTKSRPDGHIECLPECLPNLSKKSKNPHTREFVRRLRGFGLASNNDTVIVRNSQSRRGGSVQSLVVTGTLPSSETNRITVPDLGIVENGLVTNTSFDSHSTVANGDVQRIQNGRKVSIMAASNPEIPLETIQEMKLKNCMPTILTVEKAAAARIYLETFFHEKLHQNDSRDARRQQLETQLYYSPHLSEDQKHAVRRSFWSQESCHTRETRVLRCRSQAAGAGRDSSPCSDNYESLKILGKGSFGVVKLVREKSESTRTRPKQVFAMKIIRKSDMLRSSQEGHLRAERDFLVTSEGSQWAVALVCSFQDAANLYLVIDYMPGGDFLGLLIRENILPEIVARFYISEMILAVEEAHRLRFIHRDIKPDNFLISASGHLKISDFGLAFDGHWSHDVSYYNYQRNSLLTELGIRVPGDEVDQKESRDINKQLDATRAFMAGLERHERQSSTKDDNLEDLLSWRNRCGNRTSAHSMWSIGIILYECLYGQTPFLSDKGRRETKQNILNHKKMFHMPSRPCISDKCQDLMLRLIRDKDSRLCSRRYQMKDRGQLDGGRTADFYGRYVFPDDGEDIKAHRWFKNIQWERLHTLTPPFIPHLHSSDDTRYFDESGSIDDMTDSDTPGPSPVDIENVLQDFRQSFQKFALELVAEPYDTIKLRSIDQRIESASVVTSTEKEVLKHFIRMYGQKERKRPRDRILRDETTKHVALDVRKKTAFMGYTWRRMRPEGYFAVA